MATTASLLTAEEYASLPDADRPTDLVRGQVIVMPPPMPRHGELCARVAYLIQRFLEDHPLGRILSNDSGVITERDPDTVRGADVAYYSYDGVPKGPLRDGLLSTPPEFVVEVLSPEDRWSEVQQKVNEYLAIGVDTVCLVDDTTRSLHVFRTGRPPELLKATDDLSLPQILPEFQVRIGRIFE